jgi:hypothetical protein
MKPEEDPNSRLARRRRQRIKPPLVRTGQVRNLILGIVFLVLGPVLILWGISLPDRARRLMASLVATGICMVIAGIILVTWGFITGRE